MPAFYEKPQWSTKVKGEQKKGHWFSPSDCASANPARPRRDFRKDQKTSRCQLGTCCTYSGQGWYRSEHCVTSDPQQKGCTWRAVSMTAACHNSGNKPSNNSGNKPSAQPHSTANSPHRLSTSSWLSAEFYTSCKAEASVLYHTSDLALIPDWVQQNSSPCTLL